jgi:hypothetical protein
MKFRNSSLITVLVLLECTRVSNLGHQLSVTKFSQNENSVTTIARLQCRA